MNRLFIINSKGSKRTARFFKKHQKMLETSFAKAEYLQVDANKLQGLESYDEFEQLILIGDDQFFHVALNQLHGNLLEKDQKQHYAFLADSRESSLAQGLEMPPSVRSQIDLIKSAPTIPFDLVRCHCIGTEGLPSSQLILNDALIRLPNLKLPLLLKTAVQWFRTYSGAFGARTPNKVTLFEHGTKRYDGNYLCAILLLGNKITGGPKLTQKKRCLRNRFEYYQLNAHDLINYTASLPQLFSDDAAESENLFRGRFADLEVRGLGDENKIIADGVMIGRLPASFTLLPKALCVVSPMNPILRLEPQGTKTNGQVKPATSMNSGASKRPHRCSKTGNQTDK